MSILKRGKKYYINFRLNRRRYRRVSPDNSKAGAKAYEAQLRQSIASGKPINSFVEIKDQPTFEDFSQKWFETYVKTNNKYSETLNKESVLRAHLVPSFGSMRLDEISNLDIEDFKAKELKTGLANKTVNNSLIVLSRCLNSAKEWDILASVPKIKLLKVEPQKFDFLREEESQLLLDNCDGLLKDMILVALKTGLRFGELIALKDGDIDLKNNLLAVNKSISRGRMGSPKSNKIRFIPLLDEVCQTLNARIGKDGFIFSKSSNEPLGPVQCLRWLHRACREAGLREIGWHVFRHTFASNLAQNGVSVMLIKELLGHADLKTTLRYAHLIPLVTREAIETLNKKSGHKAATNSVLGDLKILTLAPAESKVMIKAQ